MKIPSLSVQLAGSPLGALVLFSLSAAAIVGWHQGYVRAWVALVAAVMIIKTFAAISERRRYKQWRAKWDGMGRQGSKESPARKDHPWRRAFVIILAIGFAFGIPLGLSEAHSPGPVPAPLALAWLAAVIYLFTACIRALRRKKAARMEAAEAAPATAEWILPRAAGGPTRTEVTRLLPDYCARLLQR